MDAQRRTLKTGLLQILPECCIARTSWLYGAGGKCFPDTILRLAANRPNLDVVNDQRGCPTYTVDLAHAIMELCRKDATGIVHVTECGRMHMVRFRVRNCEECRTRHRSLSDDERADGASRASSDVLRLIGNESWSIRHRNAWLARRIGAIHGRTERGKVVQLPLEFDTVRMRRGSGPVKVIQNYIDGKFVKDSGNSPT